MIGLFDGGGLHRFTLNRSQLRARLAVADRKAAKDETAICELARAVLRLEGQLTAERANREATVRQSRAAYESVTNRRIEVERERDALLAEKGRAWADAANANKKHVPAPGDDPKSAFYSGEDTAENPLPPDPSPGDWVDTTPDGWRPKPDADGEDTVPTDTRALATPDLDSADAYAAAGIPVGITAGLHAGPVIRINPNPAA